MKQIPGEGAALKRLLLCMERAWPQEACGALFISASRRWKWHPIDNLAVCPHRAFAFGDAWLGLLHKEEQKQSRLACLVHSHPNGEARLSHADIQHLAPGGRVLWPGVKQMVVVVGEEGWRELAWFGFLGGGGCGGCFGCLGSLTRVCFEARKKRKFRL